MHETFLAGLNQPFGMLLLGEWLYVANTDALACFPYREGQTKITGKGEKVLALPVGGYNNHWTRNVVASPEGSKLYVSVGSQTNVDEEGLDAKEPRRAAILEVDPDESGMRIFARERDADITARGRASQSQRDRHLRTALDGRRSWKSAPGSASPCVATPPSYAVVAVNGKVVSEKVVPSDEPTRLPGRFPFSFGGGAAPAIARAAAPREERIGPRLLRRRSGHTRISRGARRRARTPARDPVSR